jgi:hypothetical protein
MATWIIVGGCVVLALILGGAILLVLLFTRGETDDDVRFPRFRRFNKQDGETAVQPHDD